MTWKSGNKVPLLPNGHYSLQQAATSQHLFPVRIEWHLPYTEYAWNGTYLTLSRRGTALTFHRVCAERHLPYTEYALKGTYLTLSMRGTAFTLHRVCAERHLPYTEYAPNVADNEHTPNGLSYQAIK
jgi:hypothetical protein